MKNLIKSEQYPLGHKAHNPLNLTKNILVCL